MLSIADHLNENSMSFHKFVCQTIYSSFMEGFQNKWVFSANIWPDYLVTRKVYIDVGGILYLYQGFPPVREIIHSLKLVDYLYVHADKPWCLSTTLSYIMKLC